MLANYILLAFRNILKRKLYSFINIAGLSLALGCCLVSFAFINFFYNADQFHERINEIYTLQTSIISNNSSVKKGWSPLPIGEEITQFAAVEERVRLNRRSGLVTVQEETFEETFTFADPEFFNIFSFPLQSGSIHNWKENSVILAETTAIKYFGNESPIGHTVLIRFTDEPGREIQESFTVAGVLTEFPKNASFRFKFLLPFAFQEKLGLSLTDWSAHCDALFFTLPDNSHVAAIETNLQKFVPTYNHINFNFPIDRLVVQPLATASLNSYKVQEDIFSGAPKFVFIIVAVIGIFLLLMACFNYMNIAMAMATFRMKEIGVRKVMGGNRLQLIIQFVSENLILCIASLAIGVVLAQSVMIPAFGTFFGLSLSLDYSSPLLVVTCVVLVVLGVLGGSAYPALYISSFQPVEVLKDKLRITGKNWFRRSLLTFQFFLSYLSITTAIAFILNAQYQREKDWGYNPNNKLIIKTYSAEEHQQLSNEVKSNPLVTVVSGSTEPLGMQTHIRTIKHQATNYKVDEIGLGENFMESFEIRLSDGSNFKTGSESLQQSSVIVNKSFLKLVGLNDPVGKTITIDGIEVTIVGVVEDFHFEPFTEIIKPLIIRYAAMPEQRYLSIEHIPGKQAELKDQLKLLWKKIAPEKPFVCFEQNTVFDNSFQSFETATNVMKSAAFVTVLIGIFGLFGLSSLTLTRKTRELAIRKVMGSDTRHLSWILNKEIIWILIISFSLGIPISYIFLSEFLLSVSLYAMPLKSTLFIATASLLFVVSLAVVSLHLFHIVKISPVRHLREE